MKTILAGKNITVSEGLKDAVESKIGKLEKYFDKEIELYVTFEVQKQRQIIEATVNVRGTLIRAEVSSEDMYTSIDLVVDKLAHQITKHKKKLERKHHHHNNIKFDEIPEDYFDEEDEVDKFIVKTKRFEVRPMDFEEAILQMELLGHNFFLFSNAESGESNVIYKRKDGNYGLIEPKY